MDANDHFDHEITFPLPQGERFPGGGGVYLLTDEQDRFIQLASAGNLRRALDHRLTPPAENAEPQEVREDVPDRSTDRPESAGPARSRRPDLSRVVRKIRWADAHSPFEMDWLYWRIARCLRPDDYREMIGFGPVRFIHVNPQAYIPLWTIEKILQAPPGVNLGPLATGSDARAFLQNIEDCFDLCRYNHILEQAPHGQACAYFEMNRCSAPCDGTQSLPAYRQTVEQALAFALGHRKAYLQQWKKEMERAARELAFESAGVIKQRLDKARQLEHKAYRLVKPAEQFDYLIVQRGQGRTTVKPFFVRGGQITAGKMIKLKTLNQHLADWLTHFERPTLGLPQNPEQLQSLSEQIGLVSHYLHKKDPPGLFVPAGKLPGPEDLGEWIVARFGPKDKTTQPKKNDPRDGH